ncbi:lactonase family protein [Haloarcula marina]|uniref:lactonase family protein n=1 Tax=Haloarcula marina TaxID=2961574 RepID=UPI0020B68B21|nr:lactonase family protein [Halomicroarcula marina]
MTRQTAFIGTYTDGPSDGIYTCEIFPNRNPVVRDRGCNHVSDNPSFLTIHPDNRHCYAVHEVEDGGVTAFTIERDDRELQSLGRVDTGIRGPCHCSIHPSGAFLFVAHYTGAAVSVLPILDDGSLGPPSDTVSHDGYSVEPARQTHAHPHSITPGPDGRFLYVPDLGTDEILIYELNDEDGTLAQIGAHATEPGAGPRHLALHPAHQYVYVINELNSTLSAFERNPETGHLSEINTESTLPSAFDGENITADVHVHPSGRWVYGSNRGHNSIAIFEIDETTGQITSVGHESTRGEWPRNFAIDPTGQLLFAENQETNTIVAFHIDKEKGTLSHTGDVLSVPEPVCMQILQADS